MTGPEHYRTAQILLANLRGEMAGSPGVQLRTPGQQARMIAEAQAHALLALTAVIADSAHTPRGVPLVGEGMPWGVIS